MRRRGRSWVDFSRPKTGRVHRLMATRPTSGLGHQQSDLGTTLSNTACTPLELLTELVLARTRCSSLPSPHLRSPIPSPVRVALTHTNHNNYHHTYSNHPQPPPPATSQLSGGSSAKLRQTQPRSPFDLGLTSQRASPPPAPTPTPHDHSVRARPQRLRLARSRSSAGREGLCFGHEMASRLGLTRLRRMNRT